MDGKQEEDGMQEEADHQACLRKVLFAKIEGSQAFLQAVSRIPDIDCLAVSLAGPHKG